MTKLSIGIYIHDRAPISQKIYNLMAQIWSKFDLLYF